MGWGHGKKEGQGLCPWTPLRAQPLEPASFRGREGVQTTPLQGPAAALPPPKTNGFQRLCLWWGSRGQSPSAFFLSSPRLTQRILPASIALGLFLPYPAVAAGLTVYSRLDFASAVGVAFSRQTGIAVRVRRPPAHGLFARIRAEGDHPRWSVAWFYGASAAVLLDRRGLLAHGLAAPSGLTAMGAASVPADGSYVATGLGLGGVLVMPKAAPFAPPATWADLTAPAYRGLIGMNDPATSDQGVSPVMAMVQAAGGWPAAQGYFLSLKQAGLHIYGDTATTLAALRSGAIQIAIMRSSAALRASTIDPSLRVVVPKPAAVLASVIVMARHLPTPERAAAQRFIAYVNSPTALRIEMRQGGDDGAFWPVVSDVAPASAMPSAASLTPVMVDPAQSARDRSAIIAWFSKTIVGAST